MINDSNTVRKDQSFEIALTEYRGKVYGYSRSEFIVNDTLYYIVKRVKGTIDGDMCEVKDEGIISFNFPGKLDKGVKVTSIFYRNKKDSTWYLAGKWKTNQTKNYYAVTGKVDLLEEKDLTASKLFPHLEELNLANDVAFYKNRKTEVVVMKTAESENKKLETLIKAEQQTTIKPGLAFVNADANSIEIKTVPVSSTQIIRTNTEPIKAGPAIIPVETNATPLTAEVKEEIKRQKTTVKFEEPAPVKETPVFSVNSNSNNIEVPVIPIVSKPIVATNTNTEIRKPDALPILTKTNAVVSGAEVKETPERQKTIIKTEGQETIKPPVTISTIPDSKNIGVAKTPVISKPVSSLSTNPEIKKPQTLPVATTTTANLIKSEPAIIKTLSTALISPVIPENQKLLADIIAPAAFIAGRKSEFSQTVNFKSDSLELALYDNGEIDGDTVSVFMNGEALLYKQGLKATAIKKTIYLPPGKDDEFTLVLYAENLGKYPPNTGMLIVHDGEDVYNLRFSSDFQKNAGIVFRRKK